MLKISKILLYGKTPPPYGGVTTCVQNQLIALSKFDLLVELISVRSMVKRYDVAHIHYSKSWKRLLAILLSKLNCKRCIFTVHGANYYNSLFNKLSLILCDGFIVINMSLFDEMMTLNRYKNKMKFMSNIFAEGVQLCISKHYPLKIRNNCFNALVYASGRRYIAGEEVYGIDFCVRMISKLPNDVVLHVVDPSGEYSYLNDINDRIMYYGHQVCFDCALEQCDVLIRPTSTDGNSVAIQEALQRDVIVLASDCVPRVGAVVVYKYGDENDFLSKMKIVRNVESQEYTMSSVVELINYYEELV